VSVLPGETVTGSGTAVAAAIATCIFAFESSIWSRGQQSLTSTPRQSAEGQSAPTFRSGVRLIDIDVFVTDRDGRFVGDLTKDDFELVEDGTTQDIRTFSYINLPLPTATSLPSGDSPPEPDVRINTTPQDRVYVIVLDSPSTHTPPGREYVGGLAYTSLMKRVVGLFIRDSVGPTDQVAVVHTHGTFTDSQPFTTSQRLLLASIDRYGRGLSGDLGDVTAQERVARHLGSFRALQDVAERLGAISGRRKAVLWVGAQLLFAYPECPPKPPPDCVALQASYPNLMTAYRDAITAATRNNVAIYSVDPSGLTTVTGAAEMDRRAGLQVVAEDTGGLAIVGTNNFAGGFQSIVRDNSTYYILGYSPATEHRDGKFHDVRVRVTKPGLTVRARKGYFAPPAEARASSLPPLPAGVSEAARGALRVPLSVSGLGLEIFTTPLRGAGREASIVVGGRITGDLLLESRSQVALSYQVFTRDNKVQSGEYKVFTLDLAPATRQRAADTGLSFVERLNLPPGSYELRFVADQPGGNVGSVVIPLEVPPFDEPLAISGVVLAALSASDHVRLREDAALRALLGAEPTSLRRFPAGDILAAVAEVYSDDPRTTNEDVDVSARVTTTGGATVWSEMANSVEGDNGSAPGRWGFKVEISLGDIAPGSYVLSLEATSKRRPDEPVRRQIPFLVHD
jgi:VWFA-related protein